MLKGDKQGSDLAQVIVDSLTQKIEELEKMLNNEVEKWLKPNVLADHEA